MLATFFPIRLFVGSRRLQTFSEKAFILITLTSVAAFFHTFEMAWTVTFLRISI